MVLQIGSRVDAKASQSFQEVTSSIPDVRQNASGTLNENSEITES
jgi:hypothetical protein